MSPSGEIGFPSYPERANLDKSELKGEECPNSFLTTFGYDDTTQLKYVIDTLTFEHIESSISFYKDTNYIYNHYDMCDGGYFNIYTSKISKFELLNNNYVRLETAILHHRRGPIYADLKTFAVSPKYSSLACDKDYFYSFGKRMTLEEFEESESEEIVEHLLLLRRKTKQVAYEKKIIIERLNDVILLTEAIDTALKNINTNGYTLSYNRIINDSIDVNIDIKLGDLFSKKEKHLYIRRQAEGNVHINLFKWENQSFKSILNHTEWMMSYTDDTIKDVNGDGLNDFIIHWSPSSGCCLANNDFVYLNRDNGKQFSDSYGFINPTYSTKEKVIRGVLYGHLGSTGLYKYKWNNNSIDTIETIYPSLDGKQQFIKTSFLSGFEKETILNNVPSEYLKIFGYGWFSGNMNDF